MTEIEVPLPDGADWQRHAQVIEECLAKEGLTITLLGALAKYPGSTHWHAKRSGHRGTLEVTAWRGRVWFSIQSGRTGDWQEEATARLAIAITERLTHRP